MTSRKYFGNISTSHKFKVTIRLPNHVSIHNNISLKQVFLVCSKGRVFLSERVVNAQNFGADFDRAHHQSLNVLLQPPVLIGETYKTNSRHIVISWPELNSLIPLHHEVIQYNIISLYWDHPWQNTKLNYARIKYKSNPKIQSAKKVDDWIITFFHSKYKYMPAVGGKNC